MYTNIEEVNYDLECLDLERQIALEKLKLVKGFRHTILRILPDL